MTRSIRRLGALAATCALVVGSALSLSACAETSTDRAGADNSVVLGLTYIPNVQFSPAYVAAEDGLFSAEGLNVTLRHHGSDEGLFTALLAGDEDVVVASGDEAVVAAASGMDLVSIGAYYRSYPGVVIVTADSPIRSLSDLAGASIGIPGEYGASWYATLAALNEGGLSMKDVTISSIGYTQQAALAQGSVDAVVGFSNNDLVQMSNSGMDVRAIPLDATTPLVAASIITTKTWAKAHPNLATATVSALKTGIDSVVSDPSHALEVTAHWDDSLSDEATKKNAKAVLEATIPLFVDAEGSTSPLQDVDTWAGMGTFLGSVPGLLEGPIDAKTVVTNDYVDTH